MPCNFWSEQFSRCGLAKGQYPINEHASKKEESAPSASTNNASLVIAARKVVWVRANDSRFALSWAIDELETVLQRQGWQTL